jgi:hypothetical protein
MIGSESAQETSTPRRRRVKGVKDGRLACSACNSLEAAAPTGSVRGASCPAWRRTEEQEVHVDDKGRCRGRVRTVGTSEVEYVLYQFALFPCDQHHPPRSELLLCACYAQHSLPIYLVPQILGDIRLRRSTGIALETPRKPRASLVPVSLHVNASIHIRAPMLQGWCLWKLDAHAATSRSLQVSFAVSSIVTAPATRPIRLAAHEKTRSFVARINI